MHSLMHASKLSEVVIHNGKTARSLQLCRTFFLASPRPLQGKEDAEQCQKVKEAADAVKDGAKEVKETTAYIHDVASNTAKSVKNMTKDATEKVTETTEKAKGTAKGATEKATEIIKKKVLGD